MVYKPRLAQADGSLSSGRGSSSERPNMFEEDTGMNSMVAVEDGVSVGRSAAPRARRQFADCLEEARHRLGGQLGRSGRPISKPELASKMNIAPVRLGQFLDPGFTLWLTERSGLTEPSDSKKKSPSSDPRKRIMGFAASVGRACAWLSSEEMPRTPSLDNETVANIVRGYIGEDQNYKFDDTFRTIVAEALSAVGSIPSEDPIPVNIALLKWGPFGTFLEKYGRLLVDRLNPISHVSQHKEFYDEKKSLQEILRFCEDNKLDPNCAGLGVYDSLFRRFRGFQFVTFPLRVPLIGVVAVPAEAEPTAFNFEAVFGPEPRIPVLTLDKEVGHLFVASNLDDRRRDLFRVLSHKGTESEVAALVAADMRDAAEKERSAVGFLSDGILAAEVANNLRRFRDVSVHVVPQDRNSAHQLAHRIGFMLPEQNRRLAEFLELGQRELVRAPWLLKRLLQELLRGIEDWWNTLDASCRENWSAPIFLFCDADLEELAPDALTARELIAEIEVMLAKSPEIGKARTKNHLVQLVTTSGRSS